MLSKKLKKSCDTLVCQSWTDDGIAKCMICYIESVFYVSITYVEVKNYTSSNVKMSKNMALSATYFLPVARSLLSVFRIFYISRFVSFFAVNKKYESQLWLFNEQFLGLEYIALK